LSFFIIDAHVHLWNELRGCINGKKIENLSNGIVDFMGEKRQMMPPYMIEGINTAEMLISNMNYSGVSAAVVTQEYIDGIQNEYLLEVSQKYSKQFFLCGMAEFRRPGYYFQVEKLIEQGFRGIKIPAQRLAELPTRVFLNEIEMIKTFKIMEKNNIILSIDLADGDLQVEEMKEIIKECPNLKIAIGHFGMVNRDGWLNQIKLATNKNVYIESGGITWLFHKEFYPYKTAIKAIKEAAEICGIEKLMWGSDYPRTMTAITYKMSYDFIEKTNELSEIEKIKFLGENAVSFYKFKDLKPVDRIKNMLE
jgi:predicted TIM-barrel fold metal-dependent hydrolase